MNSNEKTDKQGKSMTIYDIAREAGVSASSVSRVVNNKPGVRSEVRKQIEALLEKYNYIPSETARGLVNQSSKMIGVLVANIRNVHYTDGVYFVEREFAKMGYCCIIFNTGSDEGAKAEYIRILGQRQVEGAVLIGSIFQSEEVKAAIVQYLPNCPVIMVNGYLNLSNVYGILADERDGVYNLAKLLFARGHNRLAFVNDQYTPSNKLKIEGFQKAIEEAGQKELVVYDTDGTLEDSYSVTERILDEHPEINGIIYSVDLLAVGGGKALMDRGKKVPDEIAYVGVDNSVYSQVCSPALTSLDNKLLEISSVAAKILKDALEGRQTTKKMLVYSSIVERETT